MRVPEEAVTENETDTNEDVEPQVPHDGAWMTTLYASTLSAGMSLFFIDLVRHPTPGTLSALGAPCALPARGPAGGWSPS